MIMRIIIRLKLILISAVVFNACSSEWGTHLPVEHQCALEGSKTITAINSTNFMGNKMIARLDSEAVAIKYEGMSDFKFKKWGDQNKIHIFKSPESGIFISYVDSADEWYPLLYLNEQCESAFFDIIKSRRNVVIN